MTAGVRYLGQLWLQLHQLQPAPAVVLKHVSFRCTCYVHVAAAVRGMSLTKNVIQLIKEDHDRARSLYDQYKLPGTTASQKRMLAWAIIREISIHSAKEEEVSLALAVAACAATTSIC